MKPQVLIAIAIKNAEEAINFYKNIFDLKVIELNKENAGIKIIDSTLEINNWRFKIYDIDSEVKETENNNWEIHLIYDSRKKVKDIFEKLKLSGEQIIKLGEHYSDTYLGKIKDKYNINWCILTRNEE